MPFETVAVVTFVLAAFGVFVGVLAYVQLAERRGH